MLIDIFPKGKPSKSPQFNRQRAEAAIKRSLTTLEVSPTSLERESSVLMNVKKERKKSLPPNEPKSKPISRKTTRKSDNEDPTKLITDSPKIQNLKKDKSIDFSHSNPSKEDSDNTYDIIELFENERIRSSSDAPQYIPDPPPLSDLPSPTNSRNHLMTSRSLKTWGKQSKAKDTTNPRRKTATRPPPKKVSVEDITISFINHIKTERRKSVTTEYNSLAEIYLKLQILKGENLLIPGKNSMGNPYIKMMVRSLKGNIKMCQSSIKYNQMNPIWNEEIIICQGPIFPIQGVCMLAHDFRKANSSMDEVVGTFHIEEEDFKKLDLPYQIWYPLKKIDQELITTPRIYIEILLSSVKM